MIRTVMGWALVGAAWFGFGFYMMLAMMGI